MNIEQNEIAYAIDYAWRALKSVEPQVRGAVPAQDVRVALERIEHIMQRWGRNCPNCGESAGLHPYCVDCQREAEAE